MEVIYRIKDGKNTVGYVLKDWKGNVETVQIDDIKKCTITNARITDDNEVVALAGEDIENIDKRYCKIERRHTDIGKPYQVYTMQFSRLQIKQTKLVKMCKDAGANRMVFINKKDYGIKIRMLDLAAMTAMTGVEYQLFSRSDKYALVMGDMYGIYMNTNDAIKLVQYRYKWVGHTHPGAQSACLTPQDSDYKTLKMFGQSNSSIYNSIGGYYIFGELQGGF